MAAELACSTLAGQDEISTTQKLRVAEGETRNSTKRRMLRALISQFTKLIQIHVLRELWFPLCAWVCVCVRVSLIESDLVAVHYYTVFRLLEQYGQDVYGVKSLRRCLQKKAFPLDWTN